MNSVRALGARLVGLKMAQILPIIGIIVGMASTHHSSVPSGVCATTLPRRSCWKRYGSGEDARRGAVRRSRRSGRVDEELAHYVELKAESRP